MAKNIILLATYWNEIDWIDASLRQIEKIDPVETIICEGCFDPTRPLHSTDGTREKIKDFVESRENAKMISAQRLSRSNAVWKRLSGYGNVQNTVFCPGRWKVAAKTAWVAAYRRNQAHTFNQMIQTSDFWEPGRWFMTYDCDQFYTDETISKFSITNEDTDFGLLTADEYTFIDSFWKYTEEYEERRFNNMPHKIYPDTTIKPTRVLYRACKPHQKNGIFASHLYRDNVKTHDVGRYHHYKMKEEARTRKAYELGDRKEPKWKDYNTKNFRGKHPKIIQEEFL